MSRAPSGTACPSMRSISLAIASASGTPRVRMPTSIRSATPRLRSTISPAIRRITRAICSASRMVVFGVRCFANSLSGPAGSRHGMARGKRCQRGRRRARKVRRPRRPAGRLEGLMAAKGSERERLAADRKARTGARSGGGSGPRAGTDGTGGGGGAETRGARAARAQGGATARAGAGGTGGGSGWRRHRREITFLVLFAALLGGGFTLVSLNWVNDHAVEPFTAAVARASGAALNLLGQHVRMNGTIIQGPRFAVNIRNG